MASESEWVEFIGFENEDMERAWDQGAEQSVQWWVHFFLSTSSAGSKPCLKRDYWSKFHFLVCHLKKCQEINSRRFGSIFIWTIVRTSYHEETKRATNCSKYVHCQLLSRTFTNEYRPSKFASINEAMVKYKRRLGFKQYRPMKPVKRGI